jgi:hemerythrin
MEWKEQYSLQIPEIDSEHHALVDYVTGVEEVVAKGEEWSAVCSAIERLASFAITHFTFEETLMQIQGYRDADAHVKGHQAFLAALKSIEGKGASADVTGSLRRLLEEHFTSDDRSYASSLSSKDIDRVRKYVPS